MTEEQRWGEYMDLLQRHPCTIFPTVFPLYVGFSGDDAPFHVCSSSLYAYMGRRLVFLTRFANGDIW
jgi:hypothetical protein